MKSVNTTSGESEEVITVVEKLHLLKARSTSRKENDDTAIRVLFDKNITAFHIR